MSRPPSALPYAAALARVRDIDVELSSLYARARQLLTERAAVVARAEPPPRPEPPTAPDAGRAAAEARAASAGGTGGSVRGGEVAGEPWVSWAAPSGGSCRWRHAHQQNLHGLQT